MTTTRRSSAAVAEAMPDPFGELIGHTLGLPVAPVAAKPPPPGAQLAEVRANKPPAQRRTLAMGDGAQLHVWPEAALGRGTYAKVQWGLWLGPPRPGVPRREALVAVKKARLDQLRRWQQEDGAGALSDSRLGDLSQRQARQEGTLALRAGALSAPERLVLSTKQGYLVGPPLACDLEQADQRLRSMAGVDPSAWGTFMLAELVPQLCLAHERGIAHHDLSTGNILLRGGHLHLADFGFAFIIDQARTAPAHGTPWCAAPAALCADMFERPPDPTDDFFALGVITLCLAARDVGDRLRQTLITMARAPLAERRREGYLLGFSPWWHRTTQPVVSPPTTRLFTLMSVALRTLSPQLAEFLRGLIDPVGDGRRATAAKLAARGADLLAVDARGTLAAHLANIEASCAREALASLAEPLAAVRPRKRSRSRSPEPRASA